MNTREGEHFPVWRLAMASWEMEFHLVKNRCDFSRKVYGRKVTGKRFLSKENS